MMCFFEGTGSATAKFGRLTSAGRPRRPGRSLLEPGAWPGDRCSLRPTMSLARRTVLAAFVLFAADSAALQPRVRAPPSLRAATLSPTIVPRVAVAPRASALGTSAAIFGVANAVGLAISAAWPSCHVHLDLIGTGVFAISALALKGTALPQVASASAIGLWATKLALFLFYRALQTKNDARLDETLSTFSGAFAFWFISLAWGWLVSLPHTLAAGVPVAARPAFGSWHKAGLAVFAAGFLLESSADLSKYLFKANAANAGKFCDVGVWRLSQHPNYFGNLCIWAGILLLNAPTQSATHSARTSYARSAECTV